MAPVIKDKSLLSLATELALWSLQYLIYFMGKQSFSCSGMTEIILALGFLVLFFVSVSRSNRHQCTCCCTHAHYQWSPITSYILYGESEDLVSSFTFPNQNNFSLPNLFPMSMQFKVSMKNGREISTILCF